MFEQLGFVEFRAGCSAGFGCMLDRFRFLEVVDLCMFSLSVCDDLHFLFGCVVSTWLE